MEDLHRLLKRQITRIFGSLEVIPKGFHDFILTINKTYKQFDEDLDMLERSLDLSSQELLQANIEMRAMFEAFPDLLFKIDSKGTILDYKIGSTTDRFFEPKEIIGKKIQNFPNDAINKEFEEAIQKVGQTNKSTSVEYTINLNNIENFHEARLIPLSNGQIIAITRNITELKKQIIGRELAEKALFESEEKYRIIFENNGNALMIVEEDMTISLVNKEFEKLSGYSKNDIIGKKKWTEFVSGKDDLNQISEYHRLQYSSPESNPGEFEFQFIDQANNLKDIVATMEIIPGTNQNLLSLLDISNRIKAEKEIIESENLYRTIFENTGTAAIIIEHDTTIILSNTEWAKLSGYSKEETDGIKSWTEFVVPEDLERMKTYHKIRRIDETGAPTKYEFRFIRKNGDIRYMINTVAMIPGTTKSIASLLDITEQKENLVVIKQSNLQLEDTLTTLRETQKQILQQERLRALGQLASGIAHDINNSLAPILGYSELLLKNHKNKELTEKRLKMVITSSLDIKRTIERMKEFYKPKEDQKSFRHIDLNMIVEGTLELTRHRWKDIPQSRGSVIKIEKNLQNDLSPIFGNESEIREALTNLILNAADAMPDGGTLTINTLMKNNNIILTIEDNGIGMDEETLNKCFEPFYTSKGEKGTGLGLSMVYGIINRHDANIKIESKKHKGTKISLIFSLETAIPTQSEIDVETDSIPSLRILFIDDDDNIRIMISDMLQICDHEITLASSGEEGIEKFKIGLLEGKPFDIIITDLGMPYMNGEIVAQNLKTLSPDIPIILITGWGSFINKEDMPMVDYIIQKPISFDDLKAALSKVFKK